MRTIPPIASLASCLGVVLLLTACGSDDGSSSASRTSTAAAATGSEVQSSSIETARKYVGAAHAGPVDATASPLKIGVVNQEGGAPSFPEYKQTAEVTADFVNTHLGGAGGRPLELVTCSVQTEEDGQRCAAEFRAQKLPLAIWTLGVVGNQSFYRTVDGAFPVVVSVPATGPDATTEGAYVLDGGAGPTLKAMAFEGKRLGADTVAILGADNDSGKFTLGKVLLPLVKEAGLTSKEAYFADTATIPEMVSAFQAAGAAQADAIYLLPATTAQCAAAYDAMQQLGIAKTIVSTPICSADAFVDEHAGGTPEGWEFAGPSSNPRVKDDVAGATFADVLSAAGADGAINAGYTIRTFGDVLTVAAWSNEIGGDKLDAASFRQAIDAWKGPAFGVPGTIDCGSNRDFVSVCGNAARVVGFQDGSWKSLGDVPAR